MLMNVCVYRTVFRPWRASVFHADRGPDGRQQDQHGQDEPVAHSVGAFGCHCRCDPDAHTLDSSALGGCFSLPHAVVSSAKATTTTTIIYHYDNDNIIIIVTVVRVRQVQGDYECPCRPFTYTL